MREEGDEEARHKEREKKAHTHTNTQSDREIEKLSMTKVFEFLSNIRQKCF